MTSDLDERSDSILVGSPCGFSDKQQWDSCLPTRTYDKLCSAQTLELAAGL
jgi:hypothetical protein